MFWWTITMTARFWVINEIDFELSFPFFNFSLSITKSLKSLKSLNIEKWMKYQLTHATMLKQKSVYLTQAILRASLAAPSPRVWTPIVIATYFQSALPLYTLSSLNSKMLKKFELHKLISKMLLSSHSNWTEMNEVKWKTEELKSSFTWYQTSPKLLSYLCRYRNHDRRTI